MKGYAKKFSVILFCSAFLGFLYLQTPLEIRAETLPSKTYTTADGLAHDRVNRIVRDTRGFLWFCTGEGFSRFDGYEFKNYTQAHGLPHRNTNDLLELPDGKYLVGTYDGLAIFNPNGAAANESASEARDAPPMFRTFRPPDNKPDRKAAAIQDLLRTRSGQIWVATLDGLYSFLPADDGGAGEWRFKRLEQEIFSGKKLEFVSLLEDHNEMLWLGTTTGLFLFDPKTGAITQLLDKAGIASLYEDPQKRVWVGAGYATKSGLDLFTYSPETNRPVLARKFTLEDGLTDVQWLNDAFQTYDGRILIGSANSLSEFLPGARVGEPSFRTLFQAEIVCMVEDVEGNIWLGTATRGTIKLARRGFVLFDEKDQVPRQLIQSIATGSAREIFAVSGATDLLHFDGEKFSAVKPSGMMPRSWGWGQLDFRARNGEWWIATAKGLLRYPPVKNVKDLEHTPPIKIYTTGDGLFTDEIFRLFEDSRGDVWFSVLGKAGEMGDSVMRWERAADRIQGFTKEQGFPAGNGATSFAEDRDGNVWIGFYYGGLGRYRNGQFRFFSVEGGFPTGLVHSMRLDKAGRLWIATSNSGILRLDNPAEEEPKFVNLTVANGISSNQVICLVEDNFGRMYAGTGRGVTRIEPETGRIKLYTQADGLEVTYIRTCGRDSDGDLWFGQDKKLVRLVPDVQEKSEPPPIFIADLRANGVKVRNFSELGEVAVTDLNLAADQRQIQIDFFGLGFGAGETLRYQYKLYGVDAEWSEPTTRRTVSLNLAPGSYRFLVRAVNSEGVLSAAPASISFSVARPVWQQWWFLALAILVLAIVIYSIYRRRVLRLLELERVRTRLATDLHDDIGASLSQIAILSEVVRQKVNSENGVTEPLKVIAGTSREMVDSMSDIVWAINPQKDHLSDLILRMRRFAGDTLESCDINYQFKVPEQIRDITLGADLRREIYLIFKECINNLIKHSRAGGAVIELKLENNFLIVEVRDDGRGFDAADLEHSQHDSYGGNGLPSMKRRAEKLGGSFLIESQKGKGTKTVLRLPVGKKRINLNALVRKK